MTHIANHKEFGEGAGGTMLDINCEECKERPVGGLDDKNFQALMGLTRKEFETLCIADYDKSAGQGIYNFWEAIMGANAMKVAYRKEDLQHRIKVRGEVARV